MSSMQCPTAPGPPGGDGAGSVQCAAEPHLDAQRPQVHDLRAAPVVACRHGDVAGRRPVPRLRGALSLLVAGLAAAAVLACDALPSAGRSGAVLRSVDLRTAWGEALLHPDPGVRLDAVRLLAARGASAAPLLVEVLWDREALVRQEASSVLASIGPAAIPPLVRALRDRRLSYLPRRAAETLARMGPAASAAAPALADALDAPDAYLRFRAAGALARLGPAARAAGPQLAAALEWDPATNVRLRATEALESAGTEVAGRALAKALIEDSQAAVRLRCARSLRNWLDEAGGPLSEDVRQALTTAAASDPDPRVAEAAANSLGRT